jgi:predicted MFS family arabinose efflux permease
LTRVVEESARRAWTVAAASMGLSIVILDATAVPIALPSLRLELGASTTGVQWIQGAYLLTLAALVVALARPRGLLGRGRTYAIGLLAFGAGAAIAATASSVAAVIGGRAVQGAGAGALLALSLHMTKAAAPAESRTHGLAALAAVWMVTLAIGPIVGGLAAELVSWRFVFWLGAAAAAAALAIAGYGWRRSRDEAAPEPVGEHRGHGPSAAGVAAFALAGAYCLLMLFVPQYTELVLAHSAVVSGLLVLPVTLPAVAGAPFARLLEARVGARRVLAGAFVCAILGLLVVTRIGGYAPIAPGLLLVGVALGLVLASAPIGELTFAAALGGGLLLTAGGAVFREIELDRRLDGSSFDAAFADGLAAAAWLLVAVLVAGALLTWLLAARGRRHR